MFISWLNLFFFFVFEAKPVISYTFSAATVINPADLPHQFPNDKKPNTFIRRNFDDTIEEITCPFGTKINKLAMKCVFDDGPHPALLKQIFTNDLYNCESSGDYLTANPENCRTYISCGYGQIFVMDCPVYLLFNNSTKQCDYPLEASCCEYWEKNSNQLVQ